MAARSAIANHPAFAGPSHRRPCPRPVACASLRPFARSTIRPLRRSLFADFRLDPRFLRFPADRPGLRLRPKRCFVRPSRCQGCCCAARRPGHQRPTDLPFAPCCCRIAVGFAKAHRDLARTICPAVPPCPASCRADDSLDRQAWAVPFCCRCRGRRRRPLACCRCRYPPLDSAAFRRRSAAAFVACLLARAPGPPALASSASFLRPAVATRTVGSLAACPWSLDCLAIAICRRAAAVRLALPVLLVGLRRLSLLILAA